MKKINWINVLKLVVMLSCISMIIHDSYKLIVGYGWTWLGFSTFILFWLIAGIIFEDFKDQLKKMSNAGTKDINK